MWELFDSKTDKLVFVGTEQACIEYTRQFPDRSYYMVEVKSKQNKNKI